MAAVPALMIVVGVVLVVFFVSEIRSSAKETAEMEPVAEKESEEDASAPEEESGEKK